MFAPRLFSILMTVMAPRDCSQSTGCSLYRMAEMIENLGFGDFISDFIGRVVVLTGFPAGEYALDGAVPFTFCADPASPFYEKITRADLMGPSGG